MTILGLGKSVMKRFGRYFVSVVVIAVLSVSVAGPAAVSAAESTGLSISPPTFEFTANPGDTIKNSIRVENITDEPLDVSLDIRNFSALGEEGQVDLSNEDNAYALATWITIAPPSANIPAKESKTFEYSIAVPRNAEPGGRFGSIVFQTAPKQVTSGSGVAVGQEVGALLFLKIAGDVDEDAAVASFKAASKINEFGPIPFEVRVKNTGNVQFRPRGTITITNIFGKTVETIPVDTRNVLPGAIRKMESTWKQRWLFGPYTATVSLVYGSKGQIVTASTSFWGIPYKVIAVVLLSLAVITYLVIRGRKRLLKTFKVLFGKE